MRLPVLLFLLAASLTAKPTGLIASAPVGEPLTGSAVIREMNLARQHPDQYANYLSTLRANFRGNIFILQSGALLRTHEGVAAVDETIRFLRHVRPINPLIASAGMSHAAADHVADQANGSYGHVGSDRSNPAARLNRYGSWSGYWGENISYGKPTARDIITALLIDDGQRARKHRANIFNPIFSYAGAAIGPHARYGTVCSIDFAGGYAERFQATKPLFAGN